MALSLVRTLQTMIAAGLLMLALLAGLGMLSPLPAMAQSQVCFATIDSSTVYSSTDASAVQTAVNAASEGASIKVAGTCTGVQTTANLTQTLYLNKNITLVGGYTAGAWNSTPDPAANPTILDATNLGRVIYVAAGRTVALEGLIVQNGDVTGNGGGISLETSSVLTVTNSVIRDNLASAAGGGIYVNRANLVVESGEVISNTASGNGGGIFHYDSGASVLSDTLVSYNRATVSGGGIATNQPGGNFGDVQLQLVNATVSHNQADTDGGGLWVVNKGQTDLIGTTIYSNTAADQGGGIYSGNILNITTTNFTQNQAATEGGGIYVTNFDVTLHDSQIVSNTVTVGNGGGLYLNGTSGIITQTGVVTIAQNVANGYGGGIYVRDGRLDLDGARLLSNQASGNGGGIYQYTNADSVTVTNSCLVFNSDTAVVRAGGPVLSATGNWWGYGDGPSGAGSGFGDSISDAVNIDASNFLTSAPAGCPGYDGFVLTTAKTGTGNGSVIGAGTYRSGTVVTATATADTGSTFSGWSGDCTGSGACSVTMTADKAVTATFTLNQYALTVAKAGYGSGMVSSSPAGIDCGADCNETLDPGTVITLTATADSGSGFGGWSGACTGTGDCMVTMTEAKAVTATFTKPVCFVSVNDSGSTDYVGIDAAALQTAVNDANPGDILKIAGLCPGVQVTNGMTQTVYIDKDLTLRGGYTTTNWLATPDLGANPTVLDAQGLNRVVFITGTATVSVENLTIVRGDPSGNPFPSYDGSNINEVEAGRLAAKEGSALFVGGDASLNLLSSRVQNHTHGDSVLANLGTTIISDTLFSGNAAVMTVYNLFSGSMTVDNSTFRENSGDTGAAITNEGVITLTASTLISNTSGSAGGHLANLTNSNYQPLLGFDVPAPGRVTIQDTQFISGTAPQNGGAIYNQGEVHISDSHFEGNRADKSGGAIYNTDGFDANPSFVITDTTFYSNTAGTTGGVLRQRVGQSTFTDSTFLYNSAGTSGGVVRVQSGSVTINGGTLSHNTAVEHGGALENSGSLHLDGVTITHNSANSTSSSRGGGVESGDGGTLTIANSTIAYNTGYNGGGLAVDGAASAAIVTNTTFSGNTGDEGAIHSTGQLTLTHVTVHDSVTDAGASVNAVGGSLSMRGSIVDNPTGGAAACSAPSFTDLGYNLVEDGSCITAESSQSGDPKLGPLANNGGQTLTHAPLGGSPAVDAIPGASCAVNTDQRGVSRPQGANCDVGAVEVNFPSVTVGKTGDGSGTVTSDPTGINCGVTCTDSFAYGAVVTLTAVADTGSVFTGWSGAAAGAASPVTVTITGGSVVTASFTALQLEIFAAQPGVTPGGSVVISATVQPAQAGQVVNFTVAGGGGSLSSPTAATDASGTAAVLYTAGAVTEAVQIAGALAAAPAVQDNAIVYVAAGTNAGAVGPSAGGTYTVGNLAPNHLQVVKLGAGTPIMGWAEFAGNPCPAATPGGGAVSPYVDVMVEDAAGVDAIVVTVRYTETTNAAAHELYWCNLGVWQQVSGTVNNDTAQQTLAFTITGATSPTILQLEGTPFVAVKATQTASASDFAAEAQADRVRLTWQTSHEVGLTGFHIYRGLDAAGPGDRITAAPLPAQGAGSPQGYAYSYDDVPPSARPLYYWLEEVRSDGAAIRHGPVRVGDTSFQLFLPSISVAQTGEASMQAATDAVNTIEAPVATGAVEPGESPAASEPADAVQAPDPLDTGDAVETPVASEPADAVETPAAPDTADAVETPAAAQEPDGAAPVQAESVPGDSAEAAETARSSEIFLPLIGR